MYLITTTTTVINNSKWRNTKKKMGKKKKKKKKTIAITWLGGVAKKPAVNERPTTSVASQSMVLHKDHGERDSGRHPIGVRERPGHAFCGGRSQSLFPHIRTFLSVNPHKALSPLLIFLPFYPAF